VNSAVVDTSALGQSVEGFLLHEPELTAKLLGELAFCETADFVKLFGSPSRRHDLRRRLPPTCPRWTRCPPTSPPADLPAEPEHGPAWGKGRCRAVGRRAASGEAGGAEMGQQRLSDLAAAPIGIHVEPRPNHHDERRAALCADSGRDSVVRLWGVV
jgi:hypothetical protein